MSTEEKEQVQSSYWANVFKSTSEKDELLSLLRKVQPFAELTKRELKELTTIIHYRHYHASEVIFHQGDPGIALYIVRSGKVVIKDQRTREDDILLASLSKGDFFGEIALIEGERRTATAIAETDCEFAIIFKNDFDELILKFPALGVSILQAVSRILIRRLKHLNRDYVSLHDKYNELSEDEK